MDFLRNMFGKKEQVVTQSNDDQNLQQNNQLITEEIWKLTQVQGLGSTKIAGVEIEVDIYMYSMAQLVDMRKNLESAKKSRAKINVSDATSNLFRAGLFSIASWIKEDKGDFSKFDSICQPLWQLYYQEFKPLAENIDKGKKPSTAQIQKLSERKRTLSNDSLRSEIFQGMSPLIDFLISYG